jgi:hypothetical protein
MAASTQASARERLAVLHKKLGEAERSITAKTARLERLQMERSSAVAERRQVHIARIHEQASDRHVERAERAVDDVDGRIAEAEVDRAALIEARNQLRLEIDAVEPAAIDEEFGEIR